MPNRRAIVVVTVIIVCGCSPLRFITVPDANENLGEPKRFDLVPRGHDDNGLALNPQMGWSYNKACKLGNAIVRSDADDDPQGLPISGNANSCSWRFLDRRDTEPAGADHDRRPPCTSTLMDPDLGTDLSSGVAITCSDSPLGFMGHVNWGQFFGGAVTYEGRLSWEEFSGEWPGDHDLNFRLDLAEDKRPGLGRGWETIRVEIDREEVKDLRSPWWAGFAAAVRHSSKEQLARWLDPDAEARVTGLLGMDAEHLTSDDPQIELHPAYALAMRVPLAGHQRQGDVERWAVLVRTTGNEGLCSHWHREHSMALLGGKHTVRLPWKEGKTDVSIIQGCTIFCGDPNMEDPITVRVDPDHHLLALDVPLRQGELVDGDLYLEWLDATQAAHDETTRCSKPPDEEGRCKLIVQRQRACIAPWPSMETCAPPAPVVSEARRALFRPGQGQPRPSQPECKTSETIEQGSLSQ